MSISDNCCDYKRCLLPVCVFLSFLAGGCGDLAECVVRPAYKPQGNLHSVNGEGLAVRIIIDDSRPECPARDGTPSKVFATLYGAPVPEAKNTRYIRCEPGGREVLEQGLGRALRDSGYIISADAPVVCRANLQLFKVEWGIGGWDAQVNAIVTVNYEIGLVEQVLYKKQAYEAQSDIARASGWTQFDVAGRLLSQAVSIVSERIASDPDLADACRAAQKR